MISVFSLGNFQWRENVTLPMPSSSYPSFRPLQCCGMFSLFDGKKSLQIAIITENCGIFLFNGLNRDFAHVDFQECRSVSACAYFENYSQIWVGESTGRVEIWGYYSGLKFEKSILLPFSIQHMEFVSSDLYISSGENIFVFDSFSLVPKYQWNGLSALQISSMVCSESGMLWIGKIGGILQVWNTHTFELVEELNIARLNQDLHAVPVLRILPHQSYGKGSGVLLRTLGSHEVTTYNAENGETVQSFKLPISSDPVLFSESFAEEDLLFIFEEERGSVWSSSSSF